MTIKLNIFVTTGRKCLCFRYWHAAISKFGADDDVTHTVSCEPKGWKREVGRVFSNFFFLCKVLYNTTKRRLLVSRFMCFIEYV